MRICLVCAVLLLAAGVTARAQERVLDGFDDPAAWQTFASDGVDLKVSAADDGLRLDFDFHGGGGYVIVRRAFTPPLALPPNYAFSFRVRGEAPPNNLEFKLVDPSGDNVWWLNQRDFAFPAAWRTVTVKRRHLSFAWGPSGGAEMKAVGAIEFAVSAGSGGRGTVYLDRLAFRELPPVEPYDRRPTATASSSARRAGPAQALDGRAATAWRSAADGPAWLALDFGTVREFGGLVVAWDADDYATDYAVETSADGTAWETVYTVAGGNGGRDPLYLPEQEARHLRLSLRRSSRGRGYAVREVDVRPLAFSASTNAFFEAVAAGHPAGRFPRYFRGEQSYWTVVGVSGDASEALVNTDGMIETGKQRYSIEPFLYADGRLTSWADVEAAPSLAAGYLPVPTVTWNAGAVTLEVTPWAAGEAGAATLYARYRLRNTGAAPYRGRLFLALRPFQVNPPWQFLNTPGGVSRPVRAISRADGQVRVADAPTLVTLTPPDAFGAAPFDAGDVTEYLARGAVPPQQAVADPFGYASGALAYDVALAPGGVRDVYVAVPFGPEVPAAAPDDAGAAAVAEPALAATLARWTDELSRMEVSLPPGNERLTATLRSTLAYILINRDGPAIQPGSRAYERSWIRDGSLTSAALLQAGHPDEVRQFIRWFAPFQFASGKVPCCVDHRGADPVPEHDSHGQLIYLIAEYYRFTGDVGLVGTLWPHVERAVAYIDSLRRQRMTPAYQTDSLRAFYGLLPESISHEGYSAKPMHSYWDQFFALKGLKDAAFLARVLGRPADEARIGALRDAFRVDLYASLRRAIDRGGIDYIPGSVELADFDATSTAIALYPVGELPNLPRPELERTFERYYTFFRDRRDGRLAWNEYTPYENRVIGTFVRLGWKARAHELLAFFLDDRRPPAWNHWAEVVWRDPKAPRFIGDMPHTWVGSAFISALRSFFVYERDADRALVVGAGLTDAWLAGEGATVRRFPTWYGTLHYHARREADTVRYTFSGDVVLPPGGLVLPSPLDRPIRAATADGAAVPATPAEVVITGRMPAEVVIAY